MEVEQTVAHQRIVTRSGDGNLLPLCSMAMAGVRHATPNVALSLAIKKMVK